MRRALPCILEDAENGLPALAPEIFAKFGERLGECDRRIAEYDRRLEGKILRALYSRKRNAAGFCHDP